MEENTEFEQKHIEPVKEIILEKDIDNHEHTHTNIVIAPMSLLPLMLIIQGVC